MFWFSYNGRCYKYMSSRLSWAEAEFNCVSQGANLVSIHSQGESDFVQMLIRNFDTTLHYTWIGLQDLYAPNRWAWTDGSKVKTVSLTMTEPYRRCIFN